MLMGVIHFGEVQIEMLTTRALLCKYFAVGFYKLDFTSSIVFKDVGIYKHFIVIKM